MPSKFLTKQHLAKKLFCVTGVSGCTSKLSEETLGEDAVGLVSVFVSTEGDFEISVEASGLWQAATVSDQNPLSISMLAAGSCNDSANVQHESMGDLRTSLQP
jgi:hypothetical protein